MDIVQRSTAVLLAVGAAPVMYLMIGLSVLAVAIVLERLVAFARRQDDIALLSTELEDLLGRGDLTGAVQRAQRSPSIEAAVALAGLRQASRGREAMEGVMRGALGLERARLEVRLGILGTLGNNAPFIGLFGTVIGIILAFDQLSRSSGGAAAGPASQEVMSSIAEALVSTAIGLLLAIPAVLAFNYFQRRLKTIGSRAEAIAALVAALAPMEGR